MQAPRKHHRLATCAALSIVASLVAVAAPKVMAADVEGERFFEQHIRPLLAQHCYECHAKKTKKSKGGLVLDSRAAAIKGGDLGPAVVPGQVDRSLLITAVTYGDADLAMPPKKKLADEQIHLLREWVKRGAPWPDAKAPNGGKGDADVVAGPKLPWSFRPVADPTPPAVPDAEPWQRWNRHPIDRFVGAQLHGAKLSPSPRASPRDLLRRLSFDLIGLPPTWEQVQAFEADPTPEAFAKAIDRMLADPRYGERWGRHWLDVARYADTKGYVGDNADNRYPFAYTYRDYVITAFNEDRPFDRFVLEQLAADKLGLAERDPAFAGMGYLTLGRRFTNRRDEIIDDRIDVVTRGLMAVAVQCARCHDHPHDPFTQKDYYALYGVFRSSDEPEFPPRIGEDPKTESYQRFKAELDKRRQAIDDYVKKLGRRPNQGERGHIRKLQRKVNEWIISSNDAPPRAMTMHDGRAYSPYVFLRGKPNARGPQVPRRFIESLTMVDGNKPFKDGSGRLGLAKAIVHPDNPLTARVLVNRVWLHHFGKGLVRTPDDFGFAGEEPTHPQLLDHLAAWFMNHGWSMKKLHRYILTSEAYQQASRTRTQAMEIDPENRLLWRMNPRRLDFEPMRDTMLFAAGRLDGTQFGKAVDILRADSRRRSIYGWIDRQHLPGTFRVFDFASPDASTGERPNTSVPQRALYMLNGDFVMTQARSLADLALKAQSPPERVRVLFRRLLSRDPDTGEIQEGLAFVRAQTAASGGKARFAWERYAQALLMTNEFVYVD